MHFTKFKPLFLLFSLTFFVTLFFWLAFYFHLPNRLGFPPSSLETVFSNYDGPYYLAISHCGYSQDCLRKSFSLPQPLEYYPAHLPGYPLVISFFRLFTSGPKAMLLSTLTGSLLMSLSVYLLFSGLFSVKISLFLSTVFLFLPPRLLVLRLVGAPETWFISLLLFSILFYRRQRFFLSATFVSLSLLFKTPAILLIFTYFILFVHDLFTPSSLLTKFFPRVWLFLLPLLTITAVFSAYYFYTGDFLAYFHSGDNIHLYTLPFQVFLSFKSWINSIWLEDILYLYFISAIGLYYLYRSFHFDIIFLFPLVFSAATLFVGHRDISRYLSPVYPFLFLAAKPFLTKPLFKYLLLFFLPAIFLYSINFISGNTTPIADWTPYL